MTFWHHYIYDREAALLAIVDEFNQTNEWAIIVVAEYKGSAQDIHNEMLTTINTTDVPPLVVTYQDEAIVYKITSGVIDINPLVNSPNGNFQNTNN